MRNASLGNYDESDDDPHDQSNGLGSRDQRNPLVSFPQSVEDHLARVKGRSGAEGEELMELANTQFARHAPDCFALVVAPSFGFKGVVFEDLVKDVQVVETEYRLLGIKIGSSVCTTTKVHQERRPRSFF